MQTESKNLTIDVSERSLILFHSFPSLNLRTPRMSPRGKTSRWKRRRPWSTLANLVTVAVAAPSGSAASASSVISTIQAWGRYCGVEEERHCSMVSIGWAVDWRAKYVAHAFRILILILIPRYALTMTKKFNYQGHSIFKRQKGDSKCLDICK